MDKHELICLLGSSHEELHNNGGLFFNPPVCVLKVETFEVGFDAHHLNSYLDQSIDSWTFLLIVSQLANGIRKTKSAIGTGFASAHILLD